MLLIYLVVLCTYMERDTLLGNTIFITVHEDLSSGKNSVLFMDEYGIGWQSDRVNSIFSTSQ